MRVQLLGELEVTGDDGAPVDVRGVKQRTLLALLALHRGQPVSVDRIIDALWADDAPRNPANSLQAQVAQLRRVLGSDSIVTRQGGYAMVGAVDIDEFERLVDRGRRELADGDYRRSARTLREALSLCNNEPLAEFAFADFARGERVRLDELRLSALESRLEADLAAGASGELVGELEALTVDHPLRERLWALRMKALYRAGRQADALRAFTDARRILVDELGVDPGPELQRVEAMILDHDPRLDGPAPAPSPARRLGNLPDVPTRFVGREHELSQVEALCGATRLVTLVGPGGAGKTRLAVEGAVSMAGEFPHGAWLVELAAIADPGAVTAAIATALGAEEIIDPADRTRQGAARSTIDALVSQLAGRSFLLVLDNCEHVIAEAARVADALVRGLPGLRVLATSREALNIPGERLVPVGPLPLDDALELFADRARAVAAASQLDGSGGAELAAELCQRLDGLPLAIELAAARLRALPLSQLASRLDDRFRLLTGGARTSLPRHQTLRAVVDWSYALLFSDEQLLFRRLAVFVGPFTLEDTEEVCADEHLPRDDILELLARLVDKSLVVAVAGDDARFSVLQTLREYANDRLEQSGDASSVRSRHAAHYLGMAQAARVDLRGRTAPLVRERLSSQQGNLRAAFDWFVANENATGALCLATGLAWLWFLNTEVAEGARWLGDALSAGGRRSLEAEASAHAWHALMVCMSSSPAAAAVESEAAVRALASTDDLALRAESLVVHASVLVRAHRFEHSLEVLSQARTLLDTIDEPWMAATADLIATMSLGPLGRLDEAEAAARASLERFDAVGEVTLSIDALSLLGGITEGRGDLEAAADINEATLERCRVAGLRSYIASRLQQLAGLRARQGQDELADALYEEASSNSYNPWFQAEVMVGQAAVARRLHDLPRARHLLEMAEQHYESADIEAGRAAVQAGMAWWYIAADKPEEAIAAADTAAGAAAAAAASGGEDPAMVLRAEGAQVAARALLDPTPANLDALARLAEQRGRGGVIYGSLGDESDLAALARRLSQASIPSQ